MDKYTWVDAGSSYLPGEITAAFLAAQLEEAETITRRRLAIWGRYHAWAEPFEGRGLLRRPIIPEHCTHNAHMYYLLLPSLERRTAFIAHLKASAVQAVFHYIPLHSSPAGQRFGRRSGELRVTDDASARLVRMPLWVGLEEHLDHVLASAEDALAAARPRPKTRAASSGSCPPPPFTRHSRTWWARVGCTAASCGTTSDRLRACACSTSVAARRRSWASSPLT